MSALQTDLTTLQEQVDAIPPADLSTWATHTASEDIKLGSHKLDFGTVKLEAQGDQLSTNGTLYVQKYLICNNIFQSTGDACFGVDQLAGNKSTVWVDKGGATRYCPNGQVLNSVL